MVETVYHAPACQLPENRRSFDVDDKDGNFAVDDEACGTTQEYEFRCLPDYP